MEIVAELSGNHGGKLENALRLIRAAIEAGADAVKFQCFHPMQLANKRLGIEWEGKKPTLLELMALYEKTHTPRWWFPDLIAECEGKIAWFSSVFDPDDVAFLETLGCPRYKISAYEMLDGDLINAVKATGKPIVMSVRPRPGVTVLFATEYGQKGFPRGTLGLSDHSVGNLLSAGVAANGTSMIERHLRLPDVETPDSAFSLDPEQFKQFVQDCRMG
jgi:sialic acid synthase SpsE